MNPVKASNSNHFCITQVRVATKYNEVFAVNSFHFLHYLELVVYFIDIFKLLYGEIQMKSQNNFVILINHFWTFQYCNLSILLWHLLRGAGVTLIYLWNLFSTHQLPSKLEPLTKILNGSLTPTDYRCLRCSHAHIWYSFGLNMSNSLNIPKSNIFDALLVASGVLNSYIKFHPDWTKNGWVMSQKP